MDTFLDLLATSGPMGLFAAFLVYERVKQQAAHERLVANFQRQIETISAQFDGRIETIRARYEVVITGIRAEGAEQLKQCRAEVASLLATITEAAR